MLVGVLVMVVVFGHGLHCPGDRCECPRGLPPPASYQGSLGDRAIPRAVPLYRGSMTAFGPRVVRFTPPGGLFRQNRGGEGWIRTNVDGVADRSISPLCHFAFAR